MFVQISKKNKLITDVEIINNDEIEVYYLEDFDFFENICNERGLYKMGGSDHSGILGGPGRDLEVCPYEQSGITEEDFMKIYERKLG